MAERGTGVVNDMRDWGLVTPSELERVVVLSPHLDDAVLGCGRLLAEHPGATVITVYAGAPGAYPEPMTHWDTISGFRAGDDVLAIRRGEDRGALVRARRDAGLARFRRAPVPGSSGLGRRRPDGRRARGRRA